MNLSYLIFPNIPGNVCCKYLQGSTSYQTSASDKHALDRMLALEDSVVVGELQTWLELREQKTQEPEDLRTEERT